MKRLHLLPLVAIPILLSSGCSVFGLERTVEVVHERVVTEGGVEYEDIIVGEGPIAELGQMIVVEYTGYLADGSEFDSSSDRGVMLDFTLGEAPLPGWDEGIPGMRVGGSRRMRIPPELAYGEQGIPGLVPENEPLVFEIDLVEIELPEKE